MRHFPFSIRVYLILGIVGLLLAQSMGLGVAAEPVESVVIFPFMISSGIPASKAEMVKEYASDLVLLTNEGLSETKRYSVVTFDPRLAGVKRALQEQKVSEKELSEGIDTTPDGAIRARKLAGFMGASMAIIGSVDAYEYREAAGEAELTVTMQTVDVATGKVSTVTATGTGKGISGNDSQSEMVIGISATYDVAEKLLIDVASVSPTELTGEYGSSDSEEPIPAPRKKDKAFVPALLGALLLGLLLGK